MCWGVGDRKYRGRRGEQQRGAGVEESNDVPARVPQSRDPRRSSQVSIPRDVTLASLGHSRGSTPALPYNQIPQNLANRSPGSPWEPASGGTTPGTVYSDSSPASLGSSRGRVSRGSTSSPISQYSTPGTPGFPWGSNAGLGLSDSTQKAIYSVPTSDVVSSSPVSDSNPSLASRNFNSSPVSRGSNPSPISRVKNLSPISRVSNSSPVSNGSSWNLLRSSTQKLDHPTGLDVLREGNNPIVDLVAVHGINGHREETWTAEGGFLWLRDFLHREIPNARIMTYGYDGRTQGSKTFSSQTLHDHALSLVSDLSLHRKVTETTERPIIFIAHSTGGIIVKDALIHSNSTNKNNLEHQNAIKVSTCGVLFFGTPHQGTNKLTLGNAFLNAADSKNRLLKHLKGGSGELQKQLEQYTNISKDFDTKFFYEMRKSNNGLAVPKGSAIVPGATDSETFGINSDHSNLVKYKSRDDENFRKVCSCLIVMMRDVQRRASENWQKSRRLKAAENNGVQITFEVPFELGYRKNPQFTGRRDLIKRINEESKRKVSVPIVLYGTGGIGKTQIALEYIYKYKAHYDSVFWIDATNKQTTIDGFIVAAQRLVRQYAKTSGGAKLAAKELDIAGAVDEEGLVSSKEEYNERIIQAVNRWFTRERNMKWLLVFDHVDDFDFGIHNFLPTSNGTIILTSRRLECGGLGTPLEVPEMDDSEAVDLLQKSAGQAVDSEAPKDAMALQIIKKLGGLPLAIIQAGAYIHSCQIKFGKYRDIFDEHSARLLREKPQHLVWSDQDQTIFTTWEISYKAVKDADKEAAELLSLCSFLSNENIQEDMLRCGKGLGDNDPTLSDYMRRLFSYSLIQRKGSEDSFYINPMVHLWARERLQDTDRTSKAKEAAVLVSHVVRHKYNNPPGYWEHNGSRIMAHVDVVGTNIGKYLNSEMEKSMIDDFSWLAGINKDWGRLEHAEKLQLLLVEANMKRNDKEHPETVTAIANLASIYSRQSRFEEAEELQMRVLEARRKNSTDKEEYLLTLKAMEALARTYKGLEKWEDAERLQKEAVEGRQQTQKEGHRETLMAMINLAVIYSSQSRFEDAEVLEKKVYEVRLKRLGPGHNDTISAKESLTSTYTHLGKIEELKKL